MIYGKNADIRFSIREVDEEAYQAWKAKQVYPTFQEKLMKLIESSGMTNKEFYKSAGIDRKLFSAIKKNKAYQPKKETAVACCFGLKLDCDRAEELLRLAGYSLSFSILWDKVILYCLQKKIYDIEDVNDILFAEGEKCLRV